MKEKKWLILYSTIAAFLLIACAVVIAVTDPLLHYHRPLTDVFYYSLENERSVGNGILRHCSYDALITGTSMAENFKTSEMDELFGTQSVKATFAAGSYCEINNNISDALRYNPELKTVVRCLDYVGIMDDPDRMVLTGEDYPDYLYDDSILNDARYLLNNDVLFGRVYPMFRNLFLKKNEPGMLSFDEYSNWMGEPGYVFGAKTLCAGLEGDLNIAGEMPPLSEEERMMALENVRKNVTALPQQYPDVTFYYYFAPYCTVWWQLENATGALERMIETEEIAIREILQCENIRLYSFNTFTEITADLNNYKDTMHYGEWINTLILHLMRDGQGLITWDNYEEYLHEEYNLYRNYDYNSMPSQEDYEPDSYAAEVIAQKFGY